MQVEIYENLNTSPSREIVTPLPWLRNPASSGAIFWPLGAQLEERPIKVGIITDKIPVYDRHAMDAGLL